VIPSEPRHIRGIHPSRQFRGGYPAAASPVLTSTRFTRSVCPLVQVVAAVKAFSHCDHVIESDRLLHQAPLASPAVVEQVERDGTLEVRYLIVHAVFPRAIIGSRTS
jgi:hypothetical protein